MVGLRRCVKEAGDPIREVACELLEGPSWEGWGAPRGVSKTVSGLLEGKEAEGSVGYVSSGEVDYVGQSVGTCC